MTLVLAADEDDEGFGALAAVLLFTIEPSDRALAGWGDDTAADDLADMAHAAAGWQVVR